MIRNHKNIRCLLAGIVAFGFISMVGCTKSTKDISEKVGISQAKQSEYKKTLEEKIKDNLGNLNLGEEYDFSNVTEDTKQSAYERYEKYYDDLDTSLTNLKNELNSKFSELDGKANDANKKIIDSIDNLKMSVNTIKNDLKSNKDKILNMSKDDFVNAMKDIEKPAHDARIKVKEAINSVIDIFK